MATITKVTYRKTYNLGSFQSEAIGVEMELNENEDPLTAFREMNKLTDEYHAETLSSLEQFRGTHITPLNEVKEIQVDKKTDEIQALIDGINACTELEGDNGLSSFWFRSKGNLNTVSAYKAKENELRNAK